MKQYNEIFNEARIAFKDQTLSSKDIKVILSNLPYSKTDLFIGALVKHKCLNKIKRGIYTFTEDPVLYSTLERVFKYIREKQNEYSYKSKHKDTETKSEVQKAIELLLSTGEYEIYKVEKIVNIKKTQINA